MTFIHNHGRSRSALHRLAWERTTQGRHPHPVPRGYRSSSLACSAIARITRSSRWKRLSHGLYVPREPTRLETDLAAWQLVLPPSACFTSLTAAELRGWWCPWRAPHPMFVSVPCDAPHPQRRGLFVTRHRRSIASEMINGIRLASAAETLLAAARDLGLLDRDLLALCGWASNGGRTARGQTT